jgi:hypothetical protein
LNIKAQAACSTKPVKISSVTISHKGLGASTDISRVYVLLGQTRISRSFPLPARGEWLTLSLRNVEVAPCESRTLTVAADIATDAAAASEHAFNLVSIDAHGANVTINADAQGSLQVSATGTPAVVTAELLPVLTSVSYGRNRIVARLSIQGTAGKEQRVTAITLTNNGSAADDNLQNLAWFTRTGEKISAVIPQLQGRTARITLDPGLLLEGRDAKLIELHADVRASRKRTIRWSIEEPSDIEAMEVRTR